MGIENKDKGFAEQTESRIVDAKVISWSKEDAEEYGFSELFPKKKGRKVAFAVGLDKTGGIIDALLLEDFNDLRYISDKEYQREMDNKVKEMFGLSGVENN